MMKERNQNISIFHMMSLMRSTISLSDDTQNLTKIGTESIVQMTELRIELYQALKIKDRLNYELKN